MKDNFSAQADLYARYRPVYPDSLFEFIMSNVKEKKLAWDCATGNGQTAQVLCKHFNRVYATDISKKQIENAVKAENITYALEPAEKISLPDQTVNLVTASQSLHWFDFDKFYAEVRRVSTKDGILAVWTYSLLRIDSFTDDIIAAFHYNTLENFWDNERRFVDNGYATIPFPFYQINAPTFSMEVNWDLSQLTGYLHTWSGLQKFITTEGYNPVPALIDRIKTQWPSGQKKKIIFPLHTKMAFVR